MSMLRIGLGGTNYIDTIEQKIVFKGKDITLTTSESMLLEKLAADEKRIFEYAAIADYIWEYGNGDPKKSVQDLVSGLKRKAPFLDPFIHNVRGTGYRWGGATTSPYESFFDLIDAVLQTTLPNYSVEINSNTKKCPFSRATLIALAKTELNVDVDNDLSADYSAGDLNAIVESSQHELLREFSKRKYCFVDQKGLVCIQCLYGSGNGTLEPQAQFEVFRKLFNAYCDYNMHDYVSSQKKIELNITASVYLNALAQNQGVFSTIERKDYLCRVIEKFVRTHNHDVNYLYPILYNPKAQKPPLVDIGVEKTVQYVCEYCKDVFDTDNNTVSFIPNFLLSLERHYHVNAWDKTEILQRLVYKYKLYNLRVWKALADIDSKNMGVLQSYVSRTVFPISNYPSNQGISANEEKELIAFICMFGRGSFGNLLSYGDNSFKSGVVQTARSVLLRFKRLAKHNPIRKKDIAQGVSRLVLSLSRYDRDKAAEVFLGITVSDAFYDELPLLKDVYNHIVHKKLLMTPFYEKCFETTEEFLEDIKQRFVPIEDNPLLEEDNPALLGILSVLRHGARRKQISGDLLEFADRILFWMIEAAKQDLERQLDIRYIKTLTEVPNCLQQERSGDYFEARQKLFLDIFEKSILERIGKAKINNMWKLFSYQLAQGEYWPLVNKTCMYCIDNNRLAENLDFALYYLPYFDGHLRNEIIAFVKQLIDRDQHLEWRHHIVEKTVYVLEEYNQIGDCAEKLLISIPKYRNLTDYHRIAQFEKIATPELCSGIVNSLVNRELQYQELLFCLTKATMAAWQRACLKDLFSSLLVWEHFEKLRHDCQLAVLHFAKDKAEYRSVLAELTCVLAKNNLYDELNPRIKTALVLHASDYMDVYAPANRCYLNHLEEMLAMLTNTSNTRHNIISEYGISFETLAYHIITVFKNQPEKTALLCICLMCKTYKQFIQINTTSFAQPQNYQLLLDRIRLFTTVIANPCTRAVAFFFVNRMYKLISKDWDVNVHKIMSLKILLVNCLRGTWPDWFGYEYNSNDILQKDSIEERVITREMFNVDFAPNSTIPSNELARKELGMWRAKGEFDQPFRPSERSEVFVIKEGEKYSPISAWTVVYESYAHEDINPPGIQAIVVSWAKIRDCSHADLDPSPLLLEQILQNFQTLFDDLIGILPAYVKRRKHGRFYLDEDARCVIPPKKLTAIAAYVNFYYDYIFQSDQDNHRINANVLEAYDAYYHEVYAIYQDVVGNYVK